MIRYRGSLHQSILAKKNLLQTCLNDRNFHPLPISLTASKKTSLKYISVKFMWRPNILPLKIIFSKIDISLFLNVCSALSNCWIEGRENKLVLFCYGGLPPCLHTFHRIFGAPQAKNFGGMLKGTLNLMPRMILKPPHKKCSPHAPLIKK